MTVVECPNCKKHMRVTVSSDDPTVFDVFCHECKIALEIVREYEVEWIMNYDKGDL